ncbi:MAG: DUF4157 domain-containing protein, partial [Bacteroidota bacterium]
LQALANGYVGRHAAPWQRKLAQRKEAPSPNNPSQTNPNTTGLPDALKSGVEHLSGYAMDDVKVHYNSSEPATVQAHAYAQGTDIHLGPGQEKHLPHEAWHVVQQKQGRVQPTRQMKGGKPINDDGGLEQEADEMGAKALLYSDMKGPKEFKPTGNIGSTAIQRMPYDKVKAGRWYVVRVNSEFKTLYLKEKRSANINSNKKPSFKFFETTSRSSPMTIVYSERDIVREYFPQISNISSVSSIKPHSDVVYMSDQSLLYINSMGMPSIMGKIEIVSEEEAVSIQSKLLNKKNIVSETGTQVKKEVAKRIYEKHLAREFIPEISPAPSEDSSEVVMSESSLLISQSSSSNQSTSSDQTSSSKPYNHDDWLKKSREELVDSALISSRFIGDSTTELQTDTLLRVVRASISSNKAVFMPPIWVKNILPNIPPGTKKAMAADTFDGWQKGRNAQAIEENATQKLESLEIQFGLSDAGVVKASNFDGRLFAEFKASPSLYLPLNTTAISGGKTGVALGKDKLEAVQYDGPGLSPLGQFLKFMNTHYKGKAYNSSNNVLPKVTKSSGGLSAWTNSNDSVGQEFYRPGIVEAISTTPRSGPRSGTGETKVGRMGVQEELINTGVLKAGQYQGGHLIGDQIMNPKKFDLYKSWNLAPQEQDFNSPVYEGGLEKGVAKAVKAGAEAHLKVEVSYPRDKYQVSVLNLVDRLMKGNTKKVNSSTTYTDAIKYIQQKNTSLPKNVEFLTRVPGYWHAEMEDVKKKGKIAGSVKNRLQGKQVTANIDAGSIYTPSTLNERYMFKIVTSIPGAGTGPPTT